MKTLYTCLFFFLIAFFSTAQETVSLEAGYTKDVYYQLNSKQKMPVANNNWTIAFATSAFDVSIRVNHLMVPHVYAIDGDSSTFASVNLNSIAGTEEYYNSDEYWEYGAFNMPANGSQLDYGWGSYDPGSHNVYGTRIFVLEFTNGNYKKVFVKKKSIQNVYSFMIANLDNSEFVNQSIAASSYGDRIFYYYDASGNNLLNREPMKDNWDLLFCRYYALQPNGQYYPVVGVLQHPAVKVIQLNQVPDVYNIPLSFYSDSTYTDIISTIGYDWKILNAQFQYEIKDSLAYLVKAQDNNVYKIVFNEFGGSVNGNIVFNQVPLNESSIATYQNTMQVYLLNNPIHDYLSIAIDAETNTYVQLDLMNIAGSVLISQQHQVQQGLSIQKMDIGDLTNGVYILRISKDGRSVCMKVVKL